MEKLSLDNICYEFDEDAVWEKDGKTYSFISFKKTTTFEIKGGKGNKRYQNLTVRHKDWPEFVTWMNKVINGPAREPGEEDPF